MERTGPGLAPPSGRMQISPLVINGVLYTTAGNQRSVVAIEAATGEPLWDWRPGDNERRWGDIIEPVARSAGRGVSYWNDGAGDERIFVVTPSYQLVALDATTGRPVAEFGTDGIVDLKQHNDQLIDPLTGEIGWNSAPIVARDVVIVGASHRSGGSPPSRENVKGYIRGFDVRTGELRWTFHTVPQAGEFGNDAWENDSWTYTGNTNVWTIMSADLELGYVYLPIGTPTNDWYGGHRLGDNLFAESLVCLDAATGERVWHFQMVHHDIWNYDTPTAPVLMDVTVDGRQIKGD